MILSHESPLSPVAQGVEVITPVTTIPPPSQGSIWIVKSRLNGFVHLLLGGVGAYREVLTVCVRAVRDAGVNVIGDVVERWVPEWAFICHVGEDAEGEDVWVSTRCCVHGVTSLGRIDDRSTFATFAFAFFYGIVGVGETASMGGEENGLGYAVVETYERVLPVADVVSKANAEDGGAEIVGVEVEPEGIDDSVAFVDNY